MANANFESILDQQVDNVEKPKPLPVGSYTWILTGQPRFDKSTKKLTNFVEFQCQCQQALDDVDAAALADMGGCQGKTRRLTFYLTDDAVYRLDEFLFEHLGLELGTSRKQAVAQAAGRSFVGTIRHQASEDGTRVYDNIAQTAAV